MLPSSRRVSRILFEKVMREGRVHHASSFSLRIGLHANQPSRFSFVVSKKIDKRATKRNSLRRKGYNAVSKVLEFAKPGFAILVFMKKGAEVLSQDTLTAELRDVLSKAGVIENK